MNRRDAVKRVALIMGGTLSASTLGVMLDSCTHSPKQGEGTTFQSSEKEMVNRIADIIIPRTDTPGAVDAKVPAFIVMMIKECYPIDVQKEFHEGLQHFDGWCKERLGSSFTKLSDEQQQAAVNDLDQIVLGEQGGKEEKKELAFYKKMKELTLLGFFTSETGATETLRYTPDPGEYDGCVPYEKGDKAWAT